MDKLEKLEQYFQKRRNRRAEFRAFRKFEQEKAKPQIGKNVSKLSAETKEVVRSAVRRVLKIQ